MYHHTVWLEGRLTGDPSHKQAGQYPVANFSIAVTDKVGKDAKEETCFYDCAAWRDLADLARDYLHKGTCVLVAGRFRQTEWKDRTDGKPRKKLELLVEDIGLSLRNYTPQRPGSGPPDKDEEQPAATQRQQRRPRHAESVDPDPTDDWPPRF